MATFSIAAVRDGEVRIEEHLKYADIEETDAKPYRLRAGDVLVVRGNGSRDLVGRPGIVRQLPVYGAIYPDILIRIRPHENVLISDYLVLALTGPSVRHQIANAARTSNGTYKISGGSLSAFKLPIPPRAEQIAILCHVEQETLRIDKLLEALESQIALLHERRTALVSAAVTGKIDVCSWNPSDAVLEAGEETAQYGGSPAPRRWAAGAPRG